MWCYKYYNYIQMWFPFTLHWHKITHFILLKSSVMVCSVSVCESHLVLKSKAVAFRIGLFAGSESWNDKYKTAQILSVRCKHYLPRGRVVTEIEEHAGEPVVDFIQSQLFLWRLQDCLGYNKRAFYVIIEYSEVEYSEVHLPILSWRHKWTVAWCLCIYNTQNWE